MNNQSLIQLQESHAQAVATLSMLSMCQSINDPWGVKYYSRQYDKIMQRLSAMPKMEPSDDSSLTDKQIDYLFKDEISGELEIDTNGQLITAPENK